MQLASLLWELTCAIWDHTALPVTGWCNIPIFTPTN